MTNVNTLTYSDNICINLLNVCEKFVAREDLFYARKSVSTTE